MKDGFTRIGRASAALWTALASAAGPLSAQRPCEGADSLAVVRCDTIRTYTLDPLLVEGRIDDLTGHAVTASQGVVGYQDFRLRPLLREGELLETVPGLIMTQHSGDGKSNQMFVRGFNLDHGTDFATVVEGMPVNMPTHAHGQGYTDLNFIIPELVARVEYQLGPYYADVGDFGSAGSARLRLKRSLDGPLVQTSLGEDGYRRLVGAASVELGPGRLLVGGELKRYDGPWAVPQNLAKKSAVARYSWEAGESLFSVLAMGYDNAWNASDQIPRRLVERGALTRFGQVDSTLGGASLRYSLSAEWQRTRGGTGRRLQIYGILYDLDLYSNFTYRLDDPVNGDQIEQEDDGRLVLGARYVSAREVGAHTLTLGAETRLDHLDVALRRTEGRTPVSPVRADRATQSGSGAWVELTSEWSPRLRTVLGLRGDLYYFDVTNDLTENSGTTTDAIASPKASLVFTVLPGTELYLSGGLGFHSNDARGTVQSIDPATNDPVDPVDPLVRSRGAELGLRATPRPGWRSTLTGWMVDLDSELLFVGDAGTTEPSDASRRLGLTWANFYRLASRLSAELDISLSRGRFRDLPNGSDRIPGALEEVLTAGLSWSAPERGGPFADLRLRHFGSHPLTEDDAVRASATSLVNLSAGWRLGEVQIALSVRNLLDARDTDIQYFYASRLPGEPAGGVEDVHFHPVEPRQLRLSVGWGR